MEKKMESTLVQWGIFGGSIGLMEKKMETTIWVLG